MPSRDADPCFGRSGEPAEIFPRRTDAASGVPQGMSETVRGPGGALLQPPGSAPAIGVISARHFRARAVASPASCRGRNQGGQNVRAPSCEALLIRALLSWGLMTGKRSVLVSLSRFRVRVCIKLLTAPDFCNGRTWCRSVQIEKEHRDRKAKYRGLLDAERAWEERHGIAPLRDRLQHAEAELSQLKPISVAGCAALVAYATEDLAAGEGPEWPMAALANVVEALKNIAARGLS